MFDKRAFLKAFIITLVFTLGFLTSNIYADMNVESPSNINAATNTAHVSTATDAATTAHVPATSATATTGMLSANFTDVNTNVSMTSTGVAYDDEVASPGDWVKENQIGVYSKDVVLDISDAQWATFTDTHSMEPVLSSRANAIEVVPKSADEIKVGDIVSYESKYADGFIVHRVIEKNVDSDGTYFIIKGDNNPEADPGKIRFDQIRRVVVAIIY
jgi:hypothetical protein